MNTLEKKENKWYTPNRLFSYNAFINFVMSPRGNGKTYSCKKYIVNNFKKKGKQTVFVRRTQVEIDNVKQKFWDNMSLEFPNYEFSIEGNIGLIDGEVAVHFIALSTSLNRKSDEFPHVNFIAFDEYIITKTTYNRYLKNEMIILLDLFETVFRTRTDGKVLLMANSVSFVNPFFSFFDIFPDKTKRFTKWKNGLICLEYFTSSAFIENKKQTPFGQLVDGTLYSQYAIDGEVLEDTSDFISERGNYKYKFICAFKYESFKIGVWQNLDLYSVYCDYKIENDNINKFCMRLDEQEEGYIYYKGYRGYSHKLNLVKDRATMGDIYFQTQEIKKIMQDRILPYL